MASPNLRALPLPEHIAGSEDQHLASRFSSWLQETVCGLSGHDMLTHFEKNRLSLRCIACGHESPGWELTGRPPRQVAQGDAQRHRLVVPRLVRSRVA